MLSCVAPCVSSFTSLARCAWQELSASLRNDHVQQVERTVVSKAAQLTQLTETSHAENAKLHRDLVERLETKLPPALSEEVQHHISRLEQRLEDAVSHWHFPAEAPTTARSDGSTVKVTFRFVGKEGGAALYWIDSRAREIKYSEIPHGMQVVETTQPGQCWRARDARSKRPLLEHYCATIEPAQEVLITA